MTAGLPLQAWGSALRAGVLSFASPKESSQRKGDPRVGAGCAGPLRYSAGRAAAELGLRPQTVLADCPRPSCVAQRLSWGPQRRPGSSGVPPKLIPTVNRKKRPKMKFFGGAPPPIPRHSRERGSPYPCWIRAFAGMTAPLRGHGLFYRPWKVPSNAGSGG